MVGRVATAPPAAGRVATAPPVPFEDSSAYPSSGRQSAAPLGTGSVASAPPGFAEEGTAPAADPFSGTAMERSMAMLAEAMANSTANSDRMAAALAQMVTSADRNADRATDQQAALLDRFTENARESNQKIVTSKPKLKAATAEGLRSELKRLKLFFNECKISDRRTEFRTARNIAEGLAQNELEYYIIKELGRRISTRRP